ncbi:peroxisomal biogenesis factor 11-domain-containing protein [Syncephalis plumigaleata]|nr:peroxisomal biogenesis factor 11-domain-containing protein [Syncephalis plumigaleata]
MSKFSIGVFMFFCSVHRHNFYYSNYSCCCCLLGFFVLLFPHRSLFNSVACIQFYSFYIMESKPLLAKLDRIVRFLNTVNGTDKTLMVVQYASKIVYWHLRRNGLEKQAGQVVNLSGPISDFRILLRYYGLLPLIKYWIQLETTTPTPAQKFGHNIERVQCLCNAIYYPLEHAYWLMLHKVIPAENKTINSIGYWSCRFWAAYVILEFVRLWDEYKQLKRKERRLTREIGDKASTSSTSANAEQEQLAELQMARKRLTIGTLINTAYLPLTMHWSLENSTFPDVGVGICGTIAAIAQFYTSWKATPIA